MIKNRYIGRFEIPLDYINNRPSDVLKLMNGMIVIEAQIIPEMNAIKYCAIHSIFRPIGIGERAREYILDERPDGSLFLDELQ